MAHRKITGFCEVVLSWRCYVPAVPKVVPKVLVVDDEENLCFVIAAAFRLGAFDVATAASGTDALREVERFRGQYVVATGDGFLATFDGPARGIRCAQAIQRAAQRIGMTMRAGLHTGEIELRDRNVAGIGVHIAARVCSEAHADEVLVSRTVVDLVAGSQLVFVPRGEHELKGVPGTWQIFAAADSPTEE
jgi:CheY-like chemotaxis protein